MAASFLELGQQFREHFSFGHDQHVVDDLADLHAGDARGCGLAEIAEAQAHPAHEVFVIKHADDVFRTALRVEDRDARVLAFHHASQRVVEQKVSWQRKNIRPRHHYLFDGNVVEFDGVVNHLFLKFRNLAKLAAGGDDELELVRRVDSAPPPGVLSAEETKYQAARPAHDKKNGPRNRKKSLHRRSHREGDVLGALQGQSLGHELAQQHVHVSDQAERDNDGDRVRINLGVGHAMDKLHAFHQPRNHGLTDPAQGEADDGDSQLNAVHDFIQMLVETLDDAATNASGFNELLDSGIAHADQRELGGREEGVGCDQEQDQKDPEQHKGDHGRLILTFKGSCWSSCQLSVASSLVLAVGQIADGSRVGGNLFRHHKFDAILRYPFRRLLV